MAAREEIDIDSQEDMTQYSDKQIPGNSRIEGISGNNSNKEVMDMMHTMFSKLDENSMKMSNKLDEKINECQENIKIMFNKLEQNQENIKKKE